MAAKDDGLLGPWMTTALVVGGMIGAGIFMLPVSLAPLGVNAVWGWVVSGLGAVALAANLARLASDDGGGTQAYIERVFGPTVGFAVAWLFWAGFWTSYAPLALAAASATAWLVPSFAGPQRVALLAIGFIIVLAIVNALGARSSGRTAVITTLLKLVPLLVVMVVLVEQNASGTVELDRLSAAPLSLGNVASATILTLFAMSGFENATTPVGKIRDPVRTIRRAMIGGTLFVAALYLLSSTAVTLLLSPAATAASAAPFADAVVAQWGTGAATLVAAGMAIAAFGALNGVILGGGELTYAMALRGDIPRWLAVTRGGTPLRAQQLTTLLGIALILLNLGKTTAALFTFIVLLTTSATLVLYLIGSLAALKIARTWGARLVALAGVGFSLFAFYGAGAEANAWMLALLAVGLAVRFLMRRGGSPTAPAAAPAAPRG